MMNLRSTLATSAAAVALMAGPAAQAGGYYVSLFGGLSTFDDEVEFARSTASKSAFLGSKYVSQVTLKYGDLPSFTLKTTLHYVTGSKYFSTFKTTLPYYTSTKKFTTTRNIGSFVLKGDRWDSYSLGNLKSEFTWQDDFDTGWVVGAAFGAQLSESWRAELELAYRKSDVSGGGRFERRNHADLYHNIGFKYATNYIYRQYNAGNGGLYTTGGFATSVITGTTGLFGFPVTGTLTGLPVSTATGTTTVLALKKTGYGPIPYAKVTLPYAGTTTGKLVSSGDVQVWSLMANLWYDFNFMNLNPEGFHTFAGGGLGVAQLKLDYDAAATTFGGGTIGYHLDDTGMGMAYQLGAGVGFDLGGGMMLSAQYRWFGTSDIDVGHTDLRVESHNAIISLQVPLGD